MQSIINFHKTKSELIKTKSCRDFVIIKIENIIAKL